MVLYGWIFNISGIIFFLSIIGVFVSIAKEKEKLVRVIGIIMISLLIPLTIVFIHFIIVWPDLRI